MNNFTIVYVFHPKADLCEPVEDLIFRKASPSLILDPFLQVSTYTIDKRLWDVKH